MVQYNADSVVRDIPILVDLSFDNNDEIAINNAVAQWNYALNGWEHLHVVGRIFVDDNELTKHHDGWLFVKALPTDAVIKKADKDYLPKNWVIGLTNYLGGNQVFIVKERTGKDNFLGVLLHEIGHLLGANHIGTGLMRPNFNRYHQQCIDRDAIEEVATHEKLPVDTLNYCTLD